MYITRVLSNLGAWDLLKEKYPDIHVELTKIIEIIQPERSKISREKEKTGRITYFST